MARRLGPVALSCAAAAAVACLAQGQEPPPAGPSAPATPAPPRPGSERQQLGKGQGARREHAFPGGGVDADKAREAFRNMTPEERERWLRRFRAWADMPPEKKKSLAEREEVMRRKMRDDIEEAQKELGYELNEEQKKLFAQRYVEERRRVEEQLRREMEESRKPRVKALVEKLREEFGTKAKEP